MNRLAAVRGLGVLVFMIAGLALAADAGITGEILSVDAAKNMVTLANGQFFLAQPETKLDGFKAGDQVVIVLEKDPRGDYRVKTITKTGQPQN